MLCYVCLVYHRRFGHDTPSPSSSKFGDVVIGSEIWMYVLGSSLPRSDSTDQSTTTSRAIHCLAFKGCKRRSCASLTLAWMDLTRQAVAGSVRLQIPDPLGEE